MLLPLAVVVVIVTGDPLLPIDLALYMLILLGFTLSFILYVFGPVIAAILLVIVGYKVLFKRQPQKKIEENRSTDNQAKSESVA